MSSSTRSIVAGPINQVHTTANWALKYPTHPKHLCFTLFSSTTVHSHTLAHAETSLMGLLCTQFCSAPQPPLTTGPPRLQPGQGPHRALDTRVKEQFLLRGTESLCSFYEGIRVSQTSFSRSSRNPNTPRAWLQHSQQIACALPERQFSSKFKQQITQLCLTMLPRTPRKTPTIYMQGQHSSDQINRCAMSQQYWLETSQSLTGKQHTAPQHSAQYEQSAKSL